MQKNILVKILNMYYDKEKNAYKKARIETLV